MSEARRLKLLESMGGVPLGPGINSGGGGFGMGGHYGTC